MSGSSEGLHNVVAIRYGLVAQVVNNAKKNAFNVTRAPCF
jgi:hypothetical protein